MELCYLSSYSFKCAQTLINYQLAFGSYSLFVCYLYSNWFIFIVEFEFSKILSLMMFPNQCLLSLFFKSQDSVVIYLFCSNCSAFLYSIFPENHWYTPNYLAVSNWFACLVDDGFFCLLFPVFKFYWMLFNYFSMIVFDAIILRDLDYCSHYYNYSFAF